MSIKVLVADDSITIQKVIGIIFGGDEYSLTIVDNGKSAVDKANEIIPDILLIDALMPGMSGYEAAEAIRSIPSLSAKPILILTGSFEPFDEEKAKKCGADDFISKPFESQQIITKVKDLLERGGARAQQPALVSSPPPQPSVVATTIEQPPEASASAFTSPAPAFEVPAQSFDVAPVPAFDQQPAEEPQPATPVPSDIWGAFTPESEPQNNRIAESSVHSFIPAESAEPDVFAIVSEEEGAQLLQPPISPSAASQHNTGSQWIPVEENTFEFEEETSPETPQAINSYVQETSFGDITFEETVIAAPTATAFATVHEQAFSVPAVDSSALAPDFGDSGIYEDPTAPFAPLADPAPAFSVPVEPVLAPTSIAVAAATVPAQLSEEQLKSALAGVSKDVIERIVWEIVPDLAEALIVEAIRKIKEGV